MAVVAELVASNGVRVRIHDDDMAPRGTEAAAGIAAEQCRAAREILLSYAGNTQDSFQRGGHAVGSTGKSKPVGQGMNDWDYQ